MTTLERVKKMLAQETLVIERTDPEVTVDFEAVRAELRAECLTKILRHLEPEHETS